MSKIVGIPEDKVSEIMGQEGGSQALAAYGDGSDGPFVEIHMSQAHPDAILCIDQFQRGFVCVSDEARQYHEPLDETALPAIHRMWKQAPHKFREVKRGIPKPAPLTAESGFIGELSDVDRARLRQIIRKHHRRYFADHPTDAQCDNLIEGIGLKVAERIVKQNLDAGNL